jgi:ankyrin repeat protein
MSSALDALVKAVCDNNLISLREQLKKFNSSSYSGANFGLPPRPRVLESTAPPKSVVPESNISLMHIAACFDALDCFIFLEGENLRYDQASANSYLPIHYGCANGSYEIVCYILSKDPCQATVLPSVENHLIYLATQAGSPEILQMLLENGADITKPQNLENQPIAAAIKTQHVDCLKLLLAYKNNLKFTRDVKDFSTLMLAIANRELDAVPVLLKCGEDPSYVTPRTNMSALFLACYWGEEWIDVVKMLCERATKFDLDPGVKEKAAIHWACQSKSPEIVEIVVSKGIDVNRLDRNGKTGLYYLVDICPEDKIIRILEILMEHGLEIGKGPNLSIMVDFATAIGKACKVIEWLFEHGVDPLAEYDGKKKICDLFAGHRANRDIRRIYEKYCLPALNK